MTNVGINELRLLYVAYVKEVGGNQESLQHKLFRLLVQQLKQAINEFSHKVRYILEEEKHK